MKEDIKVIQFNHVQTIYYRITWMMISLSLSFFAIGYFAAKAVRAVPAIIIEASGLFLYSHAIHFLFGWILIFYFSFKIRPLKQGIKIGKSVFSIFLSPISAAIAYFAFFILVFSSCASA